MLGRLMEPNQAANQFIEEQVLDLSLTPLTGRTISNSEKNAINDTEDTRDSSSPITTQSNIPRF